MKILSVTAHLDDMEIWLGGSVLKHISRGDECKTISFASKDDERRQEAIDSHEFMGCGLNVLDFDLFKNAEKIVNSLEDVISEEAPDVLITHWWDDPHPDHRQIFLLVQRAMIPPWIKSGRPFSFLACDVYNSQGRSSIFKPDLYIDIGKFWNKKMKVINYYKSQPVEIWKRMARNQARLYGQRTKVSYCEGFKKIPIQGTFTAQDYIGK